MAKDKTVKEIHGQTVAAGPPDAPNSTAAPDDRVVNIPLEDVTIPDYSDAVAEAIALRHKLAAEARDKQEIWSRSSEKHRGESDKEHQDRIKAEFEAAVLAVRRQETAPPLPPMQVPAAISAQTKLEMEMGAKTSAYWAEQQQYRPLPTAKEIQAAGANTPVFRPGEYAHEKGGIDKNLVTQNTPGRG
jgi:hypothetical protein